jgi:hypothetical protein
MVRIDKETCICQQSFFGNIPGITNGQWAFQLVLIKKSNLPNVLALLAKSSVVVSKYFFSL